MPTFRVWNKSEIDFTAEQLRRLRTEDLEGDTQEIYYFLIEKNGYWEIAGERPRTLRACWEVLCRLPREVTQRIMYGNPVVLVAPERACWGLAQPTSFVLPPTKPGEPDRQRFKCGWIYLAPELEDQTDRVIVAVVAHELAHVMIGDIIGDESEKKADDLIRDWGFSLELDKLREANPSHRY